MINLPAICDNCGYVFPSGFIGGGNATITMEGNKSGPCPRCGEMGSIPDGTYRIIENVIAILTAPQRTISELRSLSKTLEDAKKRGFTSKELEEKIVKDIPEMSSIMDLLPRTREEKRSDIKFLITTLLAILTIIMSMMNNDNQKPVQLNMQIEEVINYIYNFENKINNSIIDPVEVMDNTNKIKPLRVNKTGRNELCYCGSGIKYKKCHGR